MSFQRVSVRQGPTTKQLHWVHVFLQDCLRGFKGKVFAGGLWWGWMGNVTHCSLTNSFPLPLKVTMMRWRDRCPLLLLSWWNLAWGRASGKWATRGRLWHSVYDPLDHWQCDLEGVSPDSLTLACCGLVQDQKITWQNRDFHTNRER